MIPLGMIMRDVSVYSPMQRLFAEKDHFRNTLVFETPEIPFEIGVQIGVWSKYRAELPYGQFIEPNILTEKTRVLKPVDLYNLN